MVWCCLRSVVCAWLIWSVAVAAPAGAASPATVVPPPGGATAPAPVPPGAAVVVEAAPAAPGERSLLAAYFPDSWRETAFAGVAAWQWVALVAIFGAGVVVSRLVRVALAAACRRVARARRTEFDEQTVRRLTVPVGLLAAAGLWQLGLSVVALDGLAGRAGFLAVRVVATVAVVWGALRLTDLVGELFRRTAERRGVHVNNILVPLLSKAAKVGILALGAIYLASALRIEILPLLTGLGIGGLAVAFAAKDTVENFFGSVAVIVDRPFEVGDSVNIGGVVGVVESLGLRSTRVRTPAGSVVTIPNANLVRTNVENRGRPGPVAIAALVPLRTDTPAAALAHLSEALRRDAGAAFGVEPGRVVVTLAAPLPGRLELSVTLPAALPKQNEPDDRRALFLLALRAAEQAGVKVA